jgi:hypothetical protein
MAKNKIKKSIKAKDIFEGSIKFIVFIILIINLFLY